MKRAYHRDPDFMDEEEEQRNDLVLGAPALLGIFFALALICAVCFGFGYSSGHDLHLGGQSGVAAVPASSAPPEGDKASLPSRNLAPEPISPAHTSDAATDDSTAADEPKDAAATSASVDAAASTKPAAGAKASEYWPSGDPQPGQQTAAEAPPSMRGRAPGTPIAVPPNLAKPLPAKPLPGSIALISPSTTAPATTGTATGNTEALPGVALMVQIAAVSRAADANTLATALRHDGFAAIVRTATGDPLFHVQVGPFSSLTAAKAMRTRLADSGYNAFIKP